MSRKSKRWSKKSEASCTRREFLQAGAGSATFFAVPALLHGLLRHETAQASGNATWTGEPFMHMHLSGGYCSSHTAVGVDVNGADVTNATALSNIGHAADAASRITQVGQLKLFTDAQFTTGLLSGLGGSVPPELQAVMLCGTSGDDNTAGAKYGFVAAHAYAGLTSAVAASAGLSNTPSGNGTFPLANSAGTDFIFCQRVGDVINAAQLSNEMATDSNGRFFGVVADGMQRIHQAQLSYRQGEGSLARYFRTMIEGLPTSLIAKVTPGAGTDNISMNALHAQATENSAAGNLVPDSPVPSIYSLTARTAANAAAQTNDAEREAQVVFNVLKGNIGAASFSLGGYDYHGNADNVTGPKDRTAGEKVGRAIRLAIALGKPLWFLVTSDGALSANVNFNKDITVNPPGTTGNVRWEGDRRSFCRTYAFLVNLPAVTKPVVGTLNANGTTTESSPVGQDFLVSAVVMASYMTRAGRPADEITRVLKAMGLTDTQVVDVKANIFV